MSELTEAQIEAADRLNAWFAGVQVDARKELLEEMRAEVATWHVYETRDIGDAFRADAVVDLIQDRLDGLAKEGT
ncbi:hypothetical protein GCM10027059_26710 [Myceligenerans halotolerans]